MAKIFMSYSNRDNESALLIKHRLKMSGHEIVGDIDGLLSTVSWSHVLEDSLKNADIFVWILSKNSASSRFVLRDLELARVFSQVIGRPLIIPIRIDAVDIPMELEDIKILDAVDRDLDQIVDWIDREISGRHGLDLARAVKAEEAAARIQKNAPEYIEEAIEAQEAIRSRNNWAARMWYSIGFVALLFGIVFVTWSADSVWDIDENFFKLTIANFVVVGLLGACARYAFSLGKSYTSEALKASDRIHAISFGRFYLNAFPDRATWAELKEVFAHWNIDRASTFGSLDVSQIDPQLISMIAHIANANLRKK